MSEIKLTKDSIENAILTDGKLVGGYVDGDGHISAKGNGAVAIGDTIDGGIIDVSDIGSFARGYANSGTISVKGKGSHAEGYAEYSGINATGNGAHAEGYANNNGYIKATGNGAHAGGYVHDGTIDASGAGAHAEGYTQLGSIDASGLGSFAMGCAWDFGTISTKGNGAHAEGYASEYGSIVASGDGAHAEGRNTKALANGAHAEGNGTKAIGIYSHAEGNLTTASGDYSHAEGYKTIASGTASHAEGCYSSLEGTGFSWNATATTQNATITFSEDIQTLYNFTIGEYIQINSDTNNTYYIIKDVSKNSNSSTILYVNPNPIQLYSDNKTDFKRYNYIFGIAQGSYSHASGSGSALGDYSCAMGMGTIANEEAMTAIGKYNNPGKPNELFSVGYGTEGKDSNGNITTIYRNTVFNIIGVDNPGGNTCNVNLKGEVHATGGFYDDSDIRKKEILSNISLEKSYELLDKCQEIIYVLKDDPNKKEQVGMIAQEVEEFFPEIVSTDNDGFKSLDYARLSVICLRLIKDIVEQIKEIKNEIKNING